MRKNFSNEEGFWWSREKKMQILVKVIFSLIETFRDISCAVSIGARNCYMSAQNILGSYAGTGTHYDSRDTASVETEKLYQN